MAVMDRPEDKNDKPKLIYALNLLSVGNRFNKPSCIEILIAFANLYDAEAVAVYKSCVEGKQPEVYRSTFPQETENVKKNLEKNGFVLESKTL